MNMLKTYHAEVATIHNHNDWVRTKARKIDPDNELHLAETLDNLMKYFTKQYGFAGVSSNNIFWRLTRVPIRLIYIPTDAKEFITLVNPEILKTEGKDMASVEGCGSIPDKVYVVRRKPYISVSGYTLEGEYIELEYGAPDYDAGDEPLLLSYDSKACIIQHEMDHLDGITIKDEGYLFDLNSLMSEEE